MNFSLVFSGLYLNLFLTKKIKKGLLFVPHHTFDWCEMLETTKFYFVVK